MSRRGSTIPKNEYAARRRARAAERTARVDEAALRVQAAAAALVRQRARSTEARAQLSVAAAQVFALAPRLADGPYAAAVERLLGQRHLRPVLAWSPRGKGRDALFRSLADHLLARYPVPAMLWSVFFDPSVACLVPAVVNVAAGGSFFDAVRDPAFPIPLTRRMCHDLLASSPGQGGTILDAVRRVQVVAAGGDARLRAMWMRTPQARTIGTRDDESFRASVLTWLARNPLEDASQLGPLLDHVLHRRRVDGAFAMQGRSAPAMIRAMTAWHRELAEEKVLHGTVFAASGLAPARFDLSGRDRDGAPRTQIWRIDEIRTARELAAEGRRQGHCVYSYAWKVERGQCSIWSMTLEDGQGPTGHWSLLTIEVESETRRVVQARGRFNRAATSAEHGILLRWAGANGLAVLTG